ncbi:fimbrillin family protein [uncultured Bacteroides sp.]|uniref:fimbrillin family protein n=1 Tax=uncultured Bacteroides sp. TaxID=162156 RepID=UPI0025E386F5|nr:fimbrillin family protein [uncultured Bacteroides sp.]
MKQHPSIFTLAASLVCTLILALTACTPQALDELAPGTDDAPVLLTISVTDGGMYSTPDPGAKTRAEERGYQTVFTEGDQIGLYVVKDGAVEKSNLCLTLLGGKWTMPTGELYYTPDKSFYAYYPYKDDNYMRGKVSPGSNDFFETLVKDWDTKNDQSTYAAYTASDLMTARGVYNAQESTLHFPMMHRMAMAVLKMETQACNTAIDGEIEYHPQTRLLPDLKIGSNGVTYHSIDHRYLVNPAKVSAPIEISYSYIGESGPKTTSIPYEQLQSGRYKDFPINIGSSPLPVDHRPIEVGDYYMEDGTILPHNAVRQPEGYLGVVFFTGNPAEDDALLARDHSKCTHGLAVALKDATATKWSDAIETVNFWTNSPDRDEDKVNIQEISKKQGYANTKALRAYNQEFPDKKVLPVESVDAYAMIYPCPKKSSGWYWPSSGDSKQLFKISGTIFQEIGGDNFKEKSYYWTSSEASNNMASANEGYSRKQLIFSIRAILAF